MIDRLRELLRADGVTAGPWVAGWWTGQAESMCDCASKGPLLGKRPQTQYPGAGPFHIHATDFLADHHYISGPAPLCEGVAGNYDYEQGGIMGEADAALIVELRNHAGELLDAHDRMVGALAKAERLNAMLPDELTRLADLLEAKVPVPSNRTDYFEGWLDAVHAVQAELRSLRAALAVPKEENPDAPK